MKKMFLGLLLFTVVVPIFSQKLFVHKTKFFDIIYAKESEPTAALIAEYGDSYAEEISNKLGRKKPPKRMPVYINPKKEDLNAYYTSSPYSRIVLFDTVPTEGQLTNLSDNVLKVFYHELTHAISLSYFLPVLPMSFREGVAVLFESFDGVQGRLNDPLIMHHLMQGRIESTSPNWMQAAGRRDVYPGGFWAYIYGAAFADYIQKIYGPEKYGKYWHTSINFFPAGKTKKIFGKKLKNLWGNFIESIYFPQRILVPIAFLEKNKSGFDVLSSNKNGFACFDFTKKEVAFFDLRGKKEKLFTANATLSNLSFSQNNNLLLVTDTIEALNGEKSRATIFDLKARKFLKKEYKSIRYASFMGNDEFCGVEIKNQFSNLILVDANLFEKKETLFSVGPGMQYSAIYNPVMAGKNKIAFIAANGLERDILIIDTKTKEIKKIEFEKQLPAIRYLQTNNSEEEPVLTFSWAGKNMLYRSALYNVNNGQLKILDKDISGGVFFPIYFKGENSKNNQIVYIGMHSKYNSVYKISENEFSNEISNLRDLVLNTESKNETTTQNPKDVHKISVSKKPNLSILDPKNYNYASWLWKVSVGPAIRLPSPIKKLKELGFGISLSGIDPTELLALKTTSVFYVKPFFYETQVDFKVSDFTISFYDLNSQFKFRNLGGSVKAEYTIPTKSIYQNIDLNAGISFDAFSFFPKDYETAKTLYSYKLKDLVLTETLSARYSYLKTTSKLDTKFFAKNLDGIETTLGLKHSVHFPSKNNSFILETATTVFTPVVPFKFTMGGYFGNNAFYSPADGGYALFNNRAFMGMGSCLTGMSEYSEVKAYDYKSPAKNNFGFSFDVEVSIFKFDIQSGSSFLPIFYNRINTSIGYRSFLNFYGKFNKENLNFFQTVYAKIYLDISGTVKFGVEYAHPIEKIKMGKFGLILDISL